MSDYGGAMKPENHESSSENDDEQASGHDGNRNHRGSSQLGLEFSHVARSSSERLPESGPLGSGSTEGDVSAVPKVWHCRTCEERLPEGRHVYCSELCKRKWRNRGRNRRVPAVCEHCKKDCLVWASSTGGQPGRFCSRECGAAFAKASGMFKGANNPRWLGGVSKDNMRYLNRQKEKWPEKFEARQITANAINSGRLVREPCEVCAATPADAHHDDYSKPLEVRWLCERCHHDHHVAERRRVAEAKEIKASGQKAPPPVTRAKATSSKSPPAPVRSFGAFWWRGKLRRSA